MQPEPVVLVASSEFTLKSYPVRRTLEQRLVDDLKFALASSGFTGFRVEKDAARFVVCGIREPTLAAQVCRNVFGVAYAAPARLLVRPSLEDVTTCIRDEAEQRLQDNQSFAIRAHRSTPGTIPRRDVELKGGSEVLQALKHRGVRVDLSNPDVTVFADLVGDDAYVYAERLLGPGGLPLTSQWKMLAVLDSGPLTILAACAMMRRGCVVELFVPLSHRIKSLAAQSQLNLATRLATRVTRPNYKAFTIDIDQLLANVGSATVSWKECARAAAIKFARQKRFRAVIFGDVTGNLDAIVESHFAKAEVPIFYPLLGLEREDLVELSQLIGIAEDELETQKLEQALLTFNRAVDSLKVEMDNLSVHEVQL